MMIKNKLYLLYNKDPLNYKINANTDLPYRKVTLTIPRVDEKQRS